MMKYSLKRFIAAAVSTVMMCVMPGFMPADTMRIMKPIAAEAANTLADEQAKFPTGSYWNHRVDTAEQQAGNLILGDDSFSDCISDTPCYTHSGYAPIGEGCYDCNAFGNGIQCCGFAKKVAYDIYGSDPQFSWSREDVSSIKPGDVVHYYGGDAVTEHWVFVIGVDGDNIIVGECNYPDGTCRINWGRSLNRYDASWTEVFSAPYELPDIPHSIVSVPDGNYQLVNVGTGRYMNYSYGMTKTPNWITEAAGDGTIEQKFYLTNAGSNKHEIRILQSDGGYVNGNCNSAVTSGVALTRGETVEGDEARFYFYKTGDYYYIASASNPNAVVSAPGKDLGQLLFKNYEESNNQLWQLIPISSPPSDPGHDPVISPDFEKGIDISLLQSDINWQSVANGGVTFAIIPAATTNIGNAEYMNDLCFEQNYLSAKAAGLKVGTYMYSSANTKKEIESNVNDLLKTLGDKHFDLPVYIDVEQATRQTDLGKAAFTEVLSYGCSLIREAGYQPGVYANLFWLRNYIDADTLRNQGINVWMAVWPYGDKICDPADHDYSDFCNIWQYSNHGSIAGISNQVNVDVLYLKSDSVAGDINADGEFSVADVLLLQKWLLGVPDTQLADWKAGDFIKDGQLDVFDLCLMKRMLIDK